MDKFESLEKLLEEFPQISIASESDNKEILEFYHKKEMKGESSSVQYLRGEDFFAFLRERSERYIVFLLRDDTAKIRGIGVVSYRAGFVEGKREIVGYLGDLRVSFNKKLIREWRKFYSLLIKNSKFFAETFYCKSYSTVLIEGNKQSKNNLVNSGIESIQYKLQSYYQMHNLIGEIRLPKFSKAYKVENAEIKQREEILTFLNKEDANRLFGRDWGVELEYRLKYWSRFNIANFLVVKDAEGKIVAVTSFWNPNKNKQVMISEIPKVMKLIHFFRWIPFLNLRPLPLVGRPLDILYLNQIHFTSDLGQETKKHIFNKIVNHLFKERFNILAFASFAGEEEVYNSRRFIGHKIKMGYYTVHYDQQDPINLKNNQLIAFDMALV